MIVLFPLKTTQIPLKATLHPIIPNQTTLQVKIFNVIKAINFNSHRRDETQGLNEAQGLMGYKKKMSS